ncbi:glycolate oxidase subunit GlcE [Marichromatium gracile]|uniref:Glycolate oxidase FAD binding subunit n=1 Tax=Marichromatium gracile TaxID=1048 RepID=A0A4R4AHL0_MARGR|nr:glycolate oxidase subunit GlcE [Marichromatium gracile]TCW38239.1 glycolate oxidase FAD binding subunit [Marichromatium gracile]
MSQDLTAELCASVTAAIAATTPLCLRGGGTKDFLGRRCAGRPLALAGHRGILDHQPRELTLTARAGTPLREIETALAEAGQCLPFEPPHFGPGATLGGTIACGLSGPARPHAGAARDLVLGARVLTGRGEVLRFGGAVMKNVAGYDIARLMTGAFGTLGILLDISLKVLPRPEAVRTQVLDCDGDEALARLRALARRPLPLSASCHDGERLWLRLSGAERALAPAAAGIGGERVEPERAEDFWDTLIREQRHPFFTAPGAPLWRLSLPPHAPALALDAPQLIEWGGAQRWLRAAHPAEVVRAEAARLGGHATCFRGGEAMRSPFTPLSPSLLALHRNLKQAFDPHGILNPGRFHAEF